MSGLEILGAVAASLELVKAIRSSLIFLNDARNVPKHVAEQADMRFYLFVQIERFNSWCEAVGISKLARLRAENRLEGKQEATDLQKRLELDLRLSNTDVARLTFESVLRLKQKFTEASGILQDHQEYPQKEEATTIKADKAKTKTKWYKFPRGGSPGDLDHDRSDADTRSFRTISAAATKSTHWVATDRKAFTKLLAEITQTNNNLMELLEQSQRKRAHRQTDMAVLNEISIHSENISKLADDDEIKTLAKIQSLQDEGTQENKVISETLRNSQLHVYHMEEFQKEAMKLGETRSVYHLGGDTVLVEWKFYSKQKPIRVERTLQLGSLVRLLNERDSFKKFMAPKCKGLVNDDMNARVGIVFATSTVVHAGVQSTSQCQDLQTFIRKSSTTSSDIPPLGSRFEMAKHLALAMHHLHSVRWLHKSFRSDNLVFFELPSKQSLPLEKLNANHRGESNQITENNNEVGELNRLTRLDNFFSLPQLYLVGWDLSRPDHPSEFSESLSHSSAGFQSRRENIKLYSHPDLHASSSKRVRYRAQFDIYSLGLVLLEIGLWRTLDTIRKKCSNDEDFRQRLKTECCDRLSSKMGSVYWRATQRCIANDFEICSSNDGASGEYALQKAFQEQVVCELEKCFA